MQKPNILTLIILTPVLFPLMGYTNETDRPVLDGKEKTMVVVGYSTSYKWPEILLTMLDEHTGKTGVYHIANASVGGSPMAAWLGLRGPRGRMRSFDKMVRDYFDPGDLLKGAPRPTIALCQQTLQFIFGPKVAGIRGPDDTVRIKKGADTFFDLATQLNELGVESVYISTHIYKVTMEPVIKNEKYAIRALLNRNIPYIRQGPDLWMPTKEIFPEGVANDRVNPNEKGARVMAVHWYRVLAGEDAKESILQKYGKQ